MPTYRYRCESCGDEFEVWQSITDDALGTHDASITDASTTDGGCGGHVVKVLSPAGIVLKGSGFYKTDSRGSGPASKNGDGAKDSSTEHSASEGGSSEGGSKKSDTDVGSKGDSSPGSGSGSSGSGSSGSKDGGSSGSGSSGSDSKPASTTSSP